MIGTGKRWLVVAFLAACSTPAAAAGSLCEKLRTFERSEPPHASLRSWFEFHWGIDRSAVWSWGCRHSDDKVSKDTCDWLMDHVNQEFSMALPQAMMGCYGYRFPRHADYDWSNLAGTIRLRGGADRRLVMDLEYRDLPDGEVAVRVSREVLGRRYQPEILPPIGPMPISPKGDASARR